MLLYKVNLVPKEEAGTGVVARAQECRTNARKELNAEGTPKYRDSTSLDRHKGIWGPPTLLILTLPFTARPLTVLLVMLSVHARRPCLGQ